ncbi:S-adenosyl-L-methionine-dependent methyltransferase [Pyrrhoderma noxium]|uniref:S-adenosyl-L-methionine-dependent methyltransferase n=1 Tax=Pyrrhoderma noxium TaxID=2282107 RepID=A0A286UNP7_9AGAM|nr:S-adenosyl-L-methionine-dependent methyltransferase [Pyrrhoderma noxium]
MKSVRNLNRILNQSRRLASVAGGSGTVNPYTVGPFQVFDRNAKRLQKDRAVSREEGARSRTVDYVRDEVADRLVERFLDIKRSFNSVVDLGAGSGHLTRLLEPESVKKSIMLDMSQKSLERDGDEEFAVDVERIQCDEENLLQSIQPNSQEAILSCLSLHWVNDLPGVLVQIREALKPDGVFLGALFGGDTLFELRTSLQLAEVEREGGISPHVSPMTESSDMSNLMGRAGFTLLTVDVDEVKVAYPSIWELMEDLRDMGESNAVLGRRRYVHRDTLAAASAIYKELHGNEDGTIPATFQVIFVIGWKPAPNQPKALERGSGKTHLKDVL